MEKILNLGGKEFKIQVSFKKSYELTKYRNKATMGFDFTDADKDVVAEIMTFAEKKNNGEDIDATLLSPEAIKMLQEKSTKNIFSYEEIVDIVKILTGIEKEEEIEELLDLEMQETDYDSVISKIIGAINLVFMSAKGSLK